MNRLLARALLGFLLLLSAHPSVADYGLAADLPPKTYMSASGEFALRVNPSSREGAGPATYELMRAGSSMWRTELPFTLWSAVVADDGTAGGYGYSLGYNGRNFSEVGAFIVAVIGPDGAVRRQERTQRTPSQFLHTMADPRGAGLFIDTDHDRLVIRVMDTDINAGAESWWIYRLSGDAAPSRIRPQELMVDDAAVRGVIDARPIPDVPLTLVQWYLVGAGGVDGASRLGTRFTLVSPEGKPVWTLDLIDDFTQTGDAAAQRKMLDRLRARGSILATTSAGFEIRHVKPGLLVAYSVQPDAGKIDGWRVAEVSRSAVDGLEETAPAQAAMIEIPEVELQHLGAIELVSKQPENSSPIHHLYDFDLDDRGRFGFIRQCDCPGAPDVAIVDPEGQLVREIDLPKRMVGDSVSMHLAWVSGDRWLITSSEYGIGKASNAAWIDVSRGTVEPVARFEAPMIETLRGTGDGGFLALVTEHSEYTMETGLAVFDADGKLKWRVESGYEDPEKLFSPEDAAVTSQGYVVVLENVVNRVKVFDQRGAFVDSIDLEQSWGRKPNYPSGIESDGHGGVIVHDFNGTDAFVHMALDGTVKRGFTPRFGDGRKFDYLGGVQVAVDGTRWASDGASLLRLDDDGVVEQVLGELPTTDALGDVAAMAVDARGQIYAADQRTGAVHVFDRAGVPIRTCRPGANDFDGELSLPSLTVTDAGEVFLSRETTGLSSRPSYLHFNPRCDRMGVVSIKLDEVAQDWHSQPGSRNRWVVGFGNAYLTNRDGRVLSKIDRTADGQWLDHPGPAGTAPDGSIAIVSGASPASSLDASEHPPVVTLVSASGRASKTWPAPKGVVSWAGNVAFDGRRLVFATHSDGSTAKSGHPDSVVATDLEGAPLFRFRLQKGRSLGAAFLVAGHNTTELWLFDGETTIDRYAMP